MGGVGGVRGADTGGGPQEKGRWPHPGVQVLGLPLTQVMMPGCEHRVVKIWSF